MRVIFFYFFVIDFEIFENKPVEFHKKHLDHLKEKFFFFFFFLIFFNDGDLI